MSIRRKFAVNKSFFYRISCFVSFLFIYLPHNYIKLCIFGNGMIGRCLDGK